MSAVSDLQKAIMGAASNIWPELLATTVCDPKVPAPGEAIGSVYALHAISEGARLAHAIDKIGIDDHHVAQAVKALYQSGLAMMIGGP
jgi:hypothetical protein